MKKLKRNKVPTPFLLAVALLNSSCINQISGYQSDAGGIPIKLSSNILETRVADDTFENNDTIGLFVTIQPKTIDQKRYVDNMRFVYSSKSGFVPDEEIYYPEEDEKCDFTSYYPYKSSGISQGKSNIRILVNSNQNTDENFSVSDFLVARCNNITSSDEAVHLSYKHVLCKLNLVLKFKDATDINSILASNPEVYINNIYTNANYDFATNKLDSLSAIGSITPHGQWQISGDNLIGKEMIIIPQITGERPTSIILKLSGKSYMSILPSNIPLYSGERHEIVISYDDASKAINSSINHMIEPWEDSGKTDIVAKETVNAVSVSDLTFQQSNVYKVMCGGVQIAEICKEYLLADNINAQAIVAYPIINDKSDLENGTVIDVLGNSNSIHGGKASWNTATNSLTYTPGNLPVVSKFYITSSNKISLSEPINSIPIKPEEDLLTDVRGAETIVYPIVKIGTQYWMRGNLKTIYYNDGEAIISKTDCTTASAGYSKPAVDSYYFFYNANAAATGKLAPIGWDLPRQQDWDNLRNYIRNNASILKSGSTWTNSGNAVTNLTGFNAAAVGIFNPKYMNKGELVEYWTRGNLATTLGEKTIVLKSTASTMVEGSYSTTCGYSVRCIRQ
ncbi:fimbrillin family protein [uncultured Bacteroides sp.]|uniref:fimbrillin family protein n=1 Tax=uncultured Bacteroides sp. TaxID=162156 RepID=UPI002AA7BD75|nr:fimbrillin family protein [uncultured Bacteroides sp.]